MEWVKSLLVAVALALVIRWSVAEPFRIPSGSMEPTLHGDPRPFHGDRVFVNKFVYGLRFPLNGIRIPFTSTRLDYAKNRLWRNNNIQRFDIVVFKAVEGNALHTTLVKRVIGLPGEHVHIANGSVYINGESLLLPPSMPPIRYTTPLSPDAVYGILADDVHAVVPPGCYLLLGDNSGNSRDGRYFGWVPNERILGRVSCIWWPIPRWRDFTGFSHTAWWRMLVCVVGVFIFMRLFLGRSWRVPVVGGGNVHVYINRLAFGLPIPFINTPLRQWGKPCRGQLVMYRNPNADKDQPGLLVGRVAGFPGERVGFENGRFCVNGEMVQEVPFVGCDYLAGMGVGPYGRSKGREYAQVPNDGYFILTEAPGTDNHWDSRTLGWIPHRNLIGSASFIWWPLRRIRRNP